MTGDFHRLPGLAKELELLAKRKSGNERLGQLDRDLGRRVDCCQRAPDATAGKNLEAIGDSVRVSGEAVGEGAARIHPDAPAAFFSVCCVVIHGSRIAARLALLCGSRRFEAHCCGRGEAWVVARHGGRVL